VYSVRTRQLDLDTLVKNNCECRYCFERQNGVWFGEHCVWFGEHWFGLENIVFGLVNIGFGLVYIGFGLVSWVEDGSCAGRSERAVRHLTLKVNKNKIE
jgi:hypothetical protein